MTPMSERTPENERTSRQVLSTIFRRSMPLAWFAALSGWWLEVEWHGTLEALPPRQRHGGTKQLYGSGARWYARAEDALTA